MITFETFLTFAATAIVLAFIPGPDNLFVLAQSALFGPRVGIFVTLGLCSGLVVHTLAVTLGVAAVFQSSQTAFDALKIIGAAYLVYLAYNVRATLRQRRGETILMTYGGRLIMSREAEARRGKGEALGVDADACLV